MLIARHILYRRSLMYTKSFISIIFLLIASSAHAKVTAVCYGTQHQFRIYIAKNPQNLNNPVELLMKKGLKGTGPVVFRAPLSPVQKFDEKLPNVNWSYNIVADTGNFEVLRFIGKITNYRPVDPRTGVAFNAPITHIWFKHDGLKLNELLRCRFRR